MLLNSIKNGMLRRKMLPAMIHRRFVVPITGNAEMTGEIAIVSAIFSLDIPRVSCVLIGSTTNFFRSLASVLFFSVGSSTFNILILSVLTIKFIYQRHGFL